MSYAHVARDGVAANAGRFAELEAYRGLAALSIIIFHVYQYTREGMQVSSYLYEGTWLHVLFHGLRLTGMFFALSGFLLFLPFARAALEQNGAHSGRGHMIRRLIRILPLYYLALLTVWAWRFVGRADQVYDLLLHLSFTHIFHPTYIFWTIGPAWSLAVEMHFYLFLAGLGPLLYLLCGRLATPAARQWLLGGVTSLLIAGGVLFKWWATNNPMIAADDWTIFYSFPAQLDALALGMLLAVLVAGLRQGPLFGRAMALLLQVGGLGLVAATMLLDSHNALVHLYYTTLVALGATLLIGSTTLGPRNSRWERALRFGPLQHLGLVSYGMYLLHEPIMMELGKLGLLVSPAPEAFLSNLLIVVGLSIAAGTLSYYLIELPCNELRHLFDSRGQRVRRYADDLPPLSTAHVRPPLLVPVPQPATAQD